MWSDRRFSKSLHVRIADSSLIECCSICRPLVPSHAALWVGMIGIRSQPIPHHHLSLSLGSAASPNVVSSPTTESEDRRRPQAAHRTRPRPKEVGRGFENGGRSQRPRLLENKTISVVVRNGPTGSGTRDRLAHSLPHMRRCAIQRVRTRRTKYAILQGDSWIHS